MRSLKQCPSTKASISNCDINTEQDETYVHCVFYGPFIHCLWPCLAASQWTSKQEERSSLRIRKYVRGSLKHHMSSKYVERCCSSLHHYSSGLWREHGSSTDQPSLSSRNMGPGDLPRLIWPKTSSVRVAPWQQRHHVGPSTWQIHQSIKTQHVWTLLSILSLYDYETRLRSE